MNCTCYQPHPNYLLILDKKCPIHFIDGWERMIVTPHDKCFSEKDAIKKYRYWLLKGENYKWRIYKDTNENLILERS